MKSLKKNKATIKKIIMVCFSLAMPVILSWVAVSGAWFYISKNSELTVNPSLFGAELKMNGEKVANFSFRLTCATKLDRDNSELDPSDENYDPNAVERDRFFNGFVQATRITITNIGEVDLSPRITVQIGANSVLRTAVLLIDISSQSLLLDSTIFPNGRKYINYRHYIWQNLDEIDGVTGNKKYGEYGGTTENKRAVLNKMNADKGDMKGVNLARGNTYVFSIITWVDYDALLELKNSEDESIYKIDPTEATLSNFELTLTIRAVDSNAP